MITTKQKRCVNCLILTLLCSVFLSGCTRNVETTEEVEDEVVSIPLNQSVLREPLVNVVLPKRKDQQSRITNEDGTDSEAAIRDRVQFVNDGMLITQPANPDNPGRASGVKLLIPAQGDFEVALKFAIRQLDQPTVPQGAHGLSMRFVFEGSGPNLVVLGCMASANCERCLVKRVKQGDEKAQQTMNPIEFSSGTWTIKREGKVLSLIVESDEGELIATEMVKEVTGRLGATEIWCSRLRKGNAQTEILLREVTMRATELFPSHEQQRSFLPWIRWGLLILTSILVAFAYKTRSN